MRCSLTWLRIEWTTHGELNRQNGVCVPMADTVAAAVKRAQEHYRSNYAIELKEGATILYKLLYNLSLKELEVLRKYLLTAQHLG